MLAEMGLNPIIVVLPLVILGVIAAVAVRRSKSSRTGSAPVAASEHDLTHPSGDVSVGSAPHGAASQQPVEADGVDATERSTEGRVTAAAGAGTASTDAAEKSDEADGIDAVTAVSQPAPNVKERAARTRSLFASAFAAVRGRGGITQETWDDLEESLLRADIGVRLVDTLLEPLKAAVKSGQLKSPDDVITALRESMTGALSVSDRTLRLDAQGTPNVWLFVGVNGVGKTTTIGKIGTAQTRAGRRVLMAAGDTFRAAAAEQLQTWAERCGAEFVRGSEGGDPASVIFDGIQAAAARGIDLVLGDTAGRLQNKSNLMEELRKVRRVAEKADGTVNEVLLVIDATTGQNGLSQAREFAAATDVTGVVLTKFDGSAKGGIVFAIETELGIPVKLVGLGETAVDLVAFDPAEYVAALFE